MYVITPKGCKEVTFTRVLKTIEIKKWKRNECVFLSKKLHRSCTHSIVITNMCENCGTKGIYFVEKNNTVKVLCTLFCQKAK